MIRGDLWRRRLPMSQERRAQQRSVLRRRSAAWLCLVICLEAEVSRVSNLLPRITIDPERMHGRPCVLDLRITVADVLGLLASGQSRESMLQDYPYLENADIDAVLAFAANEA
jgi:uncharacterized protein (DUF433 family)